MDVAFLILLKMVFRLWLATIEFKHNAKKRLITAISLLEVTINASFN
jgi:hypothetical protein